MTWGNELIKPPRKTERRMPSAVRSPAQKKEVAMPLMITESGRDDAWMSAAMEAAGIAKSERVGIWIGGLAMPFSEVYSPPMASWGERFLPTAFDEQLAAAAQMKASISFCADHSCAVSTGLIGRTATRTGEAQTSYWVEAEDGDIGPAGMYVIGRAAEFGGSPAAVIASQIEAGAVDGLSVSGWSLQENSIFDDDVYSVLYEVARFRLAETSAVSGPAFKDTFIKVGRFEDMPVKDRSEGMEDVARSAENPEPGRSFSPDRELSDPLPRSRYREYCACRSSMAESDKADPGVGDRAALAELAEEIRRVNARQDAIEMKLRQQDLQPHAAPMAEAEDQPEIRRSFIPFPL